MQCQLTGHFPQEDSASVEKVEGSLVILDENICSYKETLDHQFFIFSAGIILGFDFVSLSR